MPSTATSPTDNGSTSSDDNGSTSSDDNGSTSSDDTGTTPGGGAPNIYSSLLVLALPIVATKVCSVIMIQMQGLCAKITQQSNYQLDKARLNIYGPIILKDAPH